MNTSQPLRFVTGLVTGTAFKFRLVRRLLFIAALLLPPAITCASETAPSVGAVAVDPTDPLTIYAATGAGVYKTTDGGKQWMLIAPELQGAHTLLIDPTTPSTLFAGVGPRGVFRSTDGGSTWTSIGVSYWWEPTLTIDPRTGALYTTIDEFGVLKWDPNQEQWTGIFPVQWLPGDYAWIYCVAVQTPAIYVGVFYGTWDVAATAVYSSFDGGMSWKSTELNIYPPTEPVPVDAIALDPANPTTAYASVGIEGLFKSADGGATWSRGDSIGSVRNIIVDPHRPNTVYAVGGTGVGKSDDGGISWTSAHASLTETLLSLSVSADVTGFAIDPQTPDTLYAGTAIGVFKTTDGGSHWAPTGLVQQSPLASLSTAPTSVISGDAAIATVTLTGPQTSDVLIALSSSDVALATVPPSVTVQAGSTTATFAVSTNPVFTAANIFVRASLGDATRSASLLLHARTSVRNVLVDPSVQGGNRAVGTVYLTRAPGSTEAVEVALASSNPAVASVPPTVTIPADATSTVFTIDTRVVEIPAPISISATYRTTAVAAITVNPPPSLLASLTLNPPSINAGTSSTGTVTLTSGAPGGGASISLSSDQQPGGFATLPSSVTVPQGATSATFIVTTSRCSPGSATILATYAGTMKSAALTATTNPDVVAIHRAQYSKGKRELRVDATSTSSTATLEVLVTSSGTLIGQLTNIGGGSYSGRFDWSVNPMDITVQSTACGTARSQVTLR